MRDEYVRDFYLLYRILTAFRSALVARNGGMVEVCVSTNRTIINQQIGNSTEITFFTITIRLQKCSSLSYPNNKQLDEFIKKSQLQTKLSK